MPFFICPHCKNRSIDADGRQGLSHQPAACERCGFGFLFELMDDYYPAPSAGLLACDSQGRILAAGRGVFELTGWHERDLMGKELVTALGLGGFAAESNPAALALEWGVRRLNERITLRSRAGTEKAVVADFFPGYDTDGGLLVALAAAA